MEDSFSFTLLLAEIRAVGLGLYRQHIIAQRMGLTFDEVGEILDRAAAVLASRKSGYRTPETVDELIPY